MGKGLIAGGGTDGLYQVTLDYGAAERDARVGDLTADLATLAGLIADAQATVDAAQLVEDIRKGWAQAATEAYIVAARAVPVAQQAVDDAAQALADLQADTDPDPADVAAAQATLAAANAALAAAKADVEPALQDYTSTATDLKNAKVQTALRRTTLVWYQAKAAQLTKDRAALAALVMTETVPAWCADLTENASGTVATIEIPGENALVLIAPAAPAHAPATDGELAARELQRDTQVFFNAAILPGWQKWRPTYRRGTITALDVDTDLAGVTLDDDRSSAQQLGINQTATLSNVPVVYMTCNADAFEVGDRCVVKFLDHDWAQPRVVGFVDHPKLCVPKLPQYIDVNYIQQNAAVVATGTRPWIWIIGTETGVAQVYYENQGIAYRPVDIVVDYWTHSSSLIDSDTYTISVTSPAVPRLPLSDCIFIDYYNTAGGVPPGGAGTMYALGKFDNGLIKVIQATYPVEMLAPPLGTVEPIVYFPGGHYTGTSTVTDVTAEIPFDTYLAGEGALPVVTVVYEARTYTYTLHSALGSSTPMGGNFLRFELPGWTP